MPTLRKVPAAEAARWREPAESRPRQPPPPRAVVDALVRSLADRSGISRVDHRATHGWLARVYPPGARGQAIVRSFADGVYGGPAVALAAAVAWRDAERATFGAPAPPPPRVWRIRTRRGAPPSGYRARRPDGRERYFADGAWGGTEQARATAWAWARADR